MNIRQIFAGSFAALLVVSFAGCKKEQRKTRERSVRVTVQKLEKRVFREQLALQGTVQPVRFATISAKISGTLEILNVEAGNHCRKGDMLFVIDRKILDNQVTVKQHEIEVKKAALNSAQHALETAQIKLVQANKDFERAEKLKNFNATSASNFENALTAQKTAEMAVKDAEAAVAYAQAQLEQAESNYAIAIQNRDDATVYAPYDCVITETFVEQNEFVSTGKNILKLENQDELELVSYISAVYYHKVIPGKTRVEVVDRDGKVLGSCVVTYKSPGVDPASRTFEIKAVIPQELKLVSGMLCDFNLVLQEKTAYGLPADAMMLRANNRYIVYTVDREGRAQAKTVERGVIDKNYCEVVNFADFQDIEIVVTGQTFVNNNTLLDINRKSEKTPDSAGQQPAAAPAAKPSAK